jgi:ABC-2 type transport system permease protein
MTAHAWLLPSRTPRSAFGKLLQSEIKVAWRVPLGLVLGVAVPVLVLVILGTIPGPDKPVKSFGGLTYFSIFFPILIALALAVISLISLPVHLATYREQGILRRMSTTPVPPFWMLAAQVIINLALAVVALGILVVAGTAGFGLGAPKAPGGFALALVLSIAAMFAIGLCISAIARTAGSAGSSGSCSCTPCCSFPACGSSRNT